MGQEVEGAHGTIVVIRSPGRNAHRVFVKGDGFPNRARKNSY